MVLAALLLLKTVFASREDKLKTRKSLKEFSITGLDFEDVKSAFEKVSTNGIKVSSGIEEINTGSLEVNTGIDPVNTDSIRVSVPSPDRGRREGKAPMTEEEETQVSRKTKEQILQEEAGLAEAIRAKLEENAELKESVLGKDLTVEDYAKRMVELNQGTWKLTLVEGVNFEEVKEIEERLKVKKTDDKANKKMERGETDSKERIPYIHDKDEFEDSDELIENTLRTRVHCLNLESVDVYMLIERKYPLSAEVCKAMLDKKLQGGKPDEDCYKLLKMMEKQAGIRKHKDWLVQEQTALGKDFSNPLMADNLPKIVDLGTRTFLVAKGLATQSYG
ncbi:hypothetical protein Tco_1082495 [Tanacetum coccineum]|uniref:Uncharacterized protein n=1 Tax=Tanacetum coccineum TaxID=301880 RepID=A0ABQ5I0W1_9ASTR